MPTNRILLSIVIPMYNGAPYIDNSMHSILNDLTIQEKIFDFIEIIIINDGSTDNGSQMAKDWAKRWNKKVRNDFIRVIDKPNGQYGSVINRAIKEVGGKYIKVLDVDDSFYSNNLIKIIQIIAGFRIDVDIIVTDFIFDKVIGNKQIVYNWTKYFEPYKILKTEDINYPNSIITMHSIIYRVDFLRELNYKQIEGIYYSDSQYSVIPFIQAKRLYYISVPLYRYYIGRNEQSINIKSMVRNRLHQKQIMEKIIEELMEIEPNSKKQAKYGWRIAKNMFEWQAMIITHDKSVNKKGKTIYNNLMNLLKLCEENENLLAYSIIKNGALSRLVRMSKGNGIIWIMRIGERLYAKYKLNVMADWEN